MRVKVIYQNGSERNFADANLVVDHNPYEKEAAITIIGLKPESSTIWKDDILGLEIFK